MKLNIDFDELMGAFEEANSEHHFFIDLEKNELFDINELLDDNSEKRLEEINKEKNLIIPERTSSDDFLLMELFVYEIAKKDFQLSDKFYNEIHKRKPFKRFKEMLDEYLGLKEDWFKFKEKYIRNDIINWLCPKLKPHSLECGRNVTAFNFGASKKQVPIKPHSPAGDFLPQQKTFRVWWHIVFLI